jgi:flavin-dependent dehydrogenase
MNAKLPPVDNLVIGGGLAGPMVALQLAAAGRAVTLLEKETHPHHKVCGEFLSPEAVHYLCQAGIDPIALGAVQIDRLRLSTGSSVVESALPFTALSLSRSALDEALLERATQHGCVVRRGVSVERLTRRGDGWAAELADGNVQSAQTVFLATGKHELRGYTRAPAVQGDLVGFKLHWDLAPEQTKALHRCMQLFLLRGGYGGLSLVENNVANLCLVVRRSVLRKFGGWNELLTDLRSDNRLIAERLAGARALWPRPLAVSSIPYGYLAGRPDGLWCVGDQAAVIPSFTGDGMSIALHSGALAARMYLRGADANQYHQRLCSQLKRSMGLATLLSRAMVTDAGRALAPVGLRMIPRAMRWMASATRIPATVLLTVGRSVVN